MSGPLLQKRSVLLVSLSSSTSSSSLSYVFPDILRGIVIMSCFVSVDPDFPPVACPRLLVHYLFFCVRRTYSKCDLVSPSSTREVVKLVLSPTTRAQKLLFRICRAASMWELVSNGCQCSNQKGHVAQLQWFNEKGEIRCLISCVNLELTTECVRVEDVFT